MISLKITSVLAILTVYCSMVIVPSAGNAVVCPNSPNHLIRACPKNEEFHCCGPCEQLGCDKRASTVRCLRCPSDCFCKAGYIRERHQPIDGTRARCIPEAQCPTPSGDRKRGGFIDA